MRTDEASVDLLETRPRVVAQQWVGAVDFDLVPKTDGNMVYFVLS